MALVLALLLGTAISRWLSQPILAMTRAARAMSHGEFDATLLVDVKSQIDAQLRSIYETYKTSPLANDAACS